LRGGFLDEPWVYEAVEREDINGKRKFRQGTSRGGVGGAVCGLVGASKDLYVVKFGHRPKNDNGE